VEGKVGLKKKSGFFGGCWSSHSGSLGLVGGKRVTRASFLSGGSGSSLTMVFYRKWACYRVRKKNCRCGGGGTRKPTQRRFQKQCEAVVRRPIRGGQGRNGAVGEDGGQVWGHKTKNKRRKGRKY